MIYPDRDIEMLAKLVHDEVEKDFNINVSDYGEY